MPFSARRLAVVGSLLPLMAVTMGQQCPGPTPLPPPPAGAWLVYLCQASDDTSTPHPASFYKELFDPAQPDLVAAYFKDASNSMVDLSGTDVFGWFPMTVSTATIAPAARNNGTNPNRSQTAQDCRAAGTAALLASGKRIDPDKYAGFIAVINVPVDAGQGGHAVIANAGEMAAFYGHEMGHVYGLPHSNAMSPDRSASHEYESGADSVYNDCWDMMSYLTCIFRFATTSHGDQGPALQAAYRRKMGWLPASAVFTKSGVDRTPSTVTLGAVSLPLGTAPVMAEIDLTSGARYVVEYRAKVGFDRSIPGAAVVIRELRRNGETYLVKRQDGGSGWVQGQRFTDSANYLGVTVDALNATSATITIDPRFSSGVAAAGETCGDKFIGQVRDCAPTLTCGPRVTPPLMSVDWYCQ